MIDSLRKEKPVQLPTGQRTYICKNCGRLRALEQKREVFIPARAGYATLSSLSQQLSHRRAKRGPKFKLKFEHARTFRSWVGVAPFGAAYSKQGKRRAVNDMFMVNIGTRKLSHPGGTRSIFHIPPVALATQSDRMSEPVAAAHPPVPCAVGAQCTPYATSLQIRVCHN